MTQALDHLTHSTSRSGSPEYARKHYGHRAEGLSDRQGVIAVMTANGSTCQEVAFELLLPLRTVQAHLYQALRILNVARVEDLTYAVIAAHYAKNLTAATTRFDTTAIPTPSIAGERPNSLAALDAAEASQAHDEEMFQVAALTLELAATRAELEQHHETMRQLHQAVDSRDTIGQAKGILMERYKISADAAFLTLREESNRSNRKLVDVAQFLIYSGEESAPERQPETVRQVH